MPSKKRPTLDLHGCTTDEVFNLLDKFIREHNKHPELCVIVGKGKGLVKKKSHFLSKRCPLPLEI